MAVRADVLVAGVGGCGASALYHVARRGVRALGIDRFEPGHDRGSSHGDTRVIRQAYFEHPDYVPLLRRAYALWSELEAESGEQLFDRCGLLGIGPADGEVIAGTRTAAAQHNLPLESIDAAGFAERFPAFTLPAGCEAIFEKQAGFLRVEDSVRTYARRARESGAEIRVGEAIQKWSADAGRVRLETDRERYEADRLILCPGAWAAELLPEFAEPAGLHLLRKALLWYPRANADSSAPRTTFVVERPDGIYYGFPCLDGHTVKVAEHSGGDPAADPFALDRSLGSGDTEGPERFIAACLPGLTPPAARHVVCVYTMTRDGHFVVDRHPQHPNVAFAVGFSGHGFKFMSAMGAILCELALDGETASPIDFLRLGRFGA